MIENLIEMSSRIVSSVAAAATVGAALLWKYVLRKPVGDSDVNEDVVALYMPSYLPHTIVVNDVTLSIVRMSWSRALNGLADEFNTLRDEFLARGDGYHTNPTIVFHSIFYGRLFELVPEVLPTFRNVQLHSQGDLFTRMFDFVVRMATSGNFDELAEQLKVLARFHNGLGVVPYDYSAMGQALMYAVQRMLGDEYTRDVELAWLHFYGYVMKCIIPEVLKRSLCTPREKREFTGSLHNRKVVVDKSVGDLRYCIPEYVESTPSAGRMTTFGRRFEDVHNTPSHMGHIERLTRKKTVCSGCMAVVVVSVPVEATHSANWVANGAVQGASPGESPSARSLRSDRSDELNRELVSVSFECPDCGVPLKFTLPLEWSRSPSSRRVSAEITPRDHNNESPVPFYNNTPPCTPSEQ